MKVDVLYVCTLYVGWSEFGERKWVLGWSGFEKKKTGTRQFVTNCFLGTYIHATVLSPFNLAGT